ncbi:class I SAM-dependent methyltransferase [Ruania alkalisoli]|uniref:Class I SAM-dependent methyltransferase n=2 Tax=Ruania alkalisoli TaxID=2779775 RepID=A0A7M1SYZ0_9MICO|nr:class I SAM-dependent methyltransferase [Ruania alkalisoli]
MGVTVLGYPGQVVEVEAVAVLPQAPPPSDGVFDDARLAAVYDALDPDRSDLDLYVDIAEELGARSVLDVGCGTGTLATMLAGRGCDVVGVDPAGASLDVARRKPHADRVRWLHGDAAAAAREFAGLQADLATMTANVAQVFVTDDAWEENLHAIATLVRPGGYLVFETRIPERRAWESWNVRDSFTSADVPGIGRVESWHELLDVRAETVTFRSHTRFADGVTIPAESTLRFRSREQVTASLARCGFLVREVRDAPDRPGREYVVLAQRVE